MKWKSGSTLRVEQPLVSDLPSGTPPLTVVSDTMVPNLNAEKISGKKFAVAATAPTSPATNDIWIDTNVNPALMKYWNGSVWVAVGSNLTGVATLTGTETLTNKTLTSPTINTATLTNPTFSGAAVAQTALGSGSPLRLKKDTVRTGNLYISYQSNTGAEVGWVGYGSPANDTFSVANTVANSDLNFITNGGKVTANGNEVLVQRTVGTGVNLNTLVSPGNYRLDSSHTNMPAGAVGYGQMIVSRAADTVSQIYMDYTNGNMFTRSGNPTDVAGVGVWSAWRKMWHDGNLDPVLKTGATMTGAIVRDYTTVKTYSNVAAYAYDTAATQTGTMKITLPVGWTSTMLRIRISGYDYTMKGAWSVDVCGYNYSTGWINYSAEISGDAPFTSVRLAYDGAKCCILLGTTTTVWNYPKINVDQVIAGYNAINGFETGWAISCLAAETGIANIVAPTVIAAYTNKNMGSWNMTATAPTLATRLNYDGYLYATRVYNAVYNDYAEFFKKDDYKLEPGDVIIKNPDGNGYIRSQEAYDPLVVGVYSDTFGQCLGGDGADDDEERYAPVGLAGRVFVKVTGDVMKGELLTASNIPGVAMAAKEYKVGTVIGKALQDHAGTHIDRIEMLIMNI